MKINLFFMMICFFVLSSCKDDAKSKKEELQDTEEEVTKFKSYVGEFIKVDDAAILKGNNFIYGVVLDSMGNELASRAEELKYDKYDMIPVVVTGDLIPNEVEEGWEKLIKIKQIIRMSEPREDDSIEIRKPIN